MYVEGLVHITELGGEYYRFDEARQELRGERTGMRYALGTPVRVQVSRVDLDGRRIDFRLVREGEELVARALRDKRGGSAAPAGESGSTRVARKRKPRTGETGPSAQPGPSGSWSGGKPAGKPAGRGAGSSAGKSRKGKR